MKFKVWIASSLCGALLLTMLAGCGSGAGTNISQETTPANNGEEQDEVYVLRAGHVLNEEGAYHKGLEAMGEYMEETSGGRLVLEIYANSQLGDERALFEGAQLGTVDIACGASSVLANFDPSCTIFDRPYLFDDREHAFQVLDGEFGQSKLEGLTQYDMVGLCYFDTGFFEILNSARPINSLEDARGLTIRTVENSVFIAYMNALGINPNPMAWTDAYVAMQNGTIDGTCNPIGPIYNTGVYEVCQNLCIAEAIYGPICVVMSKATWDRLPEDLQQIVKDAAKVGVEVERELNVNNEEALLAEMQQAGLQVTYADKDEFREACVDEVYAQFVPSVVPSEDVEAIRATSGG